ncbi:hypothetical protein H0E87_023343 [Populus deltoides]|uniref:ALOG domain-containing protein n=1 Tax=Populus deltoides TaxID=3696 RepID=A0A8T2XEF1_POPDE|nr:hypothetical protein H0E87_023343 [Populus deltoides]
MDLASPSTNPTYSSPVITSPTTTTTSTNTTTLATTTSPSSTPSRYENQKRRDWNTFCQYLRNHRPPLSLPMCSGAHVLEFLRSQQHHNQQQPQKQQQLVPVQQLLAIWGIFPAPSFYYKEKISYKMNFAYISKRIC